MELLEEMLCCRDWNEKLKIDSEASRRLNENIDYMVTKDMPKRMNAIKINRSD